MYNKQAYQRSCHSNHFGGFKHSGRHHKKSAWMDHFMMNFSTPPANVRELDDQYELHLMAPGYKKSDFIIAIIDKNISVSVKKEQMEMDESWKRKEFIPNGFSRQFELNEKVDKSNITAKYENGVLVISLPKLEGFETIREEISVE